MNRLPTSAAVAEAKLTGLKRRCFAAAMGADAGSAAEMMLEIWAIEEDAAEHRRERKRLS